MRDPADLPPRVIRPRRRPRFSDRGRTLLIIGVVVVVALLLASRAIAGFYIDFLWHQNLGRSDVFWGILTSKLFLFGGFAVLFIVLAVLNVLIADRLAPAGLSGDTHPVVLRFHELFGHRMRLVRIIAGGLLGLIVAVPAAGHWQEWLLFRNSVDFGKSDPQFGTDIGFYVFRLPFLTFLVDWLFLAVLLVLVLTIAAHVINGGIVITPPMPKIRRATKAHFAVLLAVLALLRAGGYWLERYSLTSERRGYVQGATYSVVKAQLPAVLLLLLIALLVAALFLYSVRSGSWRIPLVASGLWVVVALIGGVIYPSVVQALIVNPDQKQKEATAIERNIVATRDALGINDVVAKEISFGDLTAGKVEDDVAPLKDVRLLDPVEMLTQFTIDTGQEAGLKIKDLDVDRYDVDGRVQQTIIAARELDLQGVPNTSWQGKHLITTHGCGLVLAPASQVASNSRPIYSDIELDRPELYFSPSITDFAIVNTTTSEKSCAGTTPTPYEGNGGVELDSSFRKLAFALSFFDYNLWGADSVTEDSRIQWVRGVRERAEKLAPFLHFDRDPYPVAIDGKVLWVIDGFTTTDQYPFAQDGDRSQLDGDSGLNHVFNYLRNSVKVTVDAYTGAVVFYKMNNADPIIEAWSQAFPDLFVDAAAMPDELVDHLRYPEDLFRVQTAAYARYQLSADEFFERTDAWSVAQAPRTSPRTQAATPDAATATTEAETSQQAVDDQGSTSQRFIPYYTMFHEPGSGQDGTFAMLRPYVRYSKDDQRTELQAYMVASSDRDSYGQLTAYVVNPVVDGPLKVANNAESEDLVRREITLLNQAEGGSQVKFGDLQLVPVSNGLLYVRPLYVEVDGQSSYRKIIVSYNRDAVIADTIGQALAQLFPGFELNIGDRQGAATPPPDTSGDPVDPGTESANELLQHAQTLFDEADAALASTPPDYATYGDKQAEARGLLARALQLLEGADSTPTTAGG